jgi:hypothetical protein
MSSTEASRAPSGVAAPKKTTNANKNGDTTPAHDKSSGSDKASTATVKNETQGTAPAGDKTTKAKAKASASGKTSTANDKAPTAKTTKPKTARSKAKSNIAAARANPFRSLQRVMEVCICSYPTHHCHH